MNYEQLLTMYREQGAPNFLLALNALMQYGQERLRYVELEAFGAFINNETRERVRDFALQLADTNQAVIVAFIQRELPEIEGDGEKIPLLHDGHKDGICPCCGAEIEYLGDQEIYDDSNTVVSWKCPECGATGTAEYHGMFACHSDIEPATFRAVAYKDDDGTVENESDYDDLDEAIAFAKEHKWDAVISTETNKTLWPR